MDINGFRQMVAKNPNGFLGRYGLGNRILQEGGSFEEATEHLRVAVQLDPTRFRDPCGEILCMTDIHMAVTAPMQEKRWRLDAFEDRPNIGMQ